MKKKEKKEEIMKHPIREEKAIEGGHQQEDQPLMGYQQEIEE